MIPAKDMKRILNSPYRLLAPVEKLVLEKNLAKDAERDKKHLHPSEICKRDWCPRSSWYRINDRPEKPQSYTLQRLNIFEEGHLIHRKWQDWLTEAGVLEQAEVPVIDEEHRIIGHADGVINDKHGRAVLEIKSVGVGTVRMEDYGLFAPYASKEISLDDLWKSIKFPFDSHVRQTQLYMHCLGIHSAVILYEWKASQDVREFSVDYQPEIVQTILGSCHSVVRALEANTPPERPAWLSQDHRVCKSCPFKEECWSSNENSNKNSGSFGTAVDVSKKVRPTGQTSERDTDDSGSSRRVIR
jgi:CRISPR/Cas system-associated exonuclease Cas4 (RecB family)